MLARVAAWLNNTAVGVAVKVGIAATATYAIDNITSFDLPAYVNIALVGILVAIGDWLNPHNDRFGLEGK